MRLKASIASFFLLGFGCSCASWIQNLDPQSAVESNDITALISGCGRQTVHSGIIVCRMEEGNHTKDEYLTFHVPPDLNCKADKCSYVRVYFSDGRPMYEGAIPKGGATLKLSMQELLNKEKFELSDRGFYGVSIELIFTGPEGVEMKVYGEGHIYVRVLKRDYVPLHESAEDENYVWSWKTENNQQIKMTTGFRVYVSPIPPTKQAAPGKGSGDL